MPLLPSEPPQFSARMSLLMGWEVRRNDAGFHRPGNSAGALDIHESRRQLAGPWLVELVILDDELDLVHLAAQADHHISADIRMARNAGQHALQQLVRVAGLKGATAFMREGNHAIDVGPVAVEIGPLKAIRDVMRNGGGAINAGDDCQVVARAHPAIRPGIALEKAHLAGGIISDGPGIDAELIIPAKVFHRQVMRVYVFAGGDASIGEANNLAIFPHGCAIADFAKSNLMAGWNIFGGGDPQRVRGQFCAGFEQALNDGYVVALTEAQGELSEILFSHVTGSISNWLPQVKPAAEASS